MIIQNLQMTRSRPWSTSTFRTKSRAKAGPKLHPKFSHYHLIIDQSIHWFSLLFMNKDFFKDSLSQSGLQPAIAFSKRYPILALSLSLYSHLSLSFIHYICFPSSNCHTSLSPSLSQLFSGFIPKFMKALLSHSRIKIHRIPIVFVYVFIWPRYACCSLWISYIRPVMAQGDFIYPILIRSVLVFAFKSAANSCPPSISVFRRAIPFDFFVLPRFSPFRLLIFCLHFRPNLIPSSFYHFHTFSI